LDDKEVKSIYFGGWTPQLIWLENIEKITDTIIQYFDTENLWEFSTEMNPYPKEDVYHIVNSLTKKYREFSRVRFSFGIQSFENKMLSASWRDITFPWIVDFLRDLQPLKKDNNVFNLDFIAFGYFNKSKNWNYQLRNPTAMNFFQTLATSKFIDSYSLYTLELFPWSLRYYKEKRKSNLEQSEGSNSNLDKWQEYWDQDDVYEEFAILKDTLLDAWYKRYEISNFSLLWKSSVHNRIYREMWDYLGLGTSASSFFKNPNKKLCSLLNIPSDTKAVRWTNALEFPKLYSWQSESEIIPMTEKDLLIEEFFLWLRTDNWIKNIQKYESVLMPDYAEKINSYSDQWFIEILEDWIKFTDQWMDIYNDIVTELLDEI
jgi:oxygen-independent coproporphyrinogen-3 oxidase